MPHLPQKEKASHTLGRWAFPVSQVLQAKEKAMRAILAECPYLIFVVAMAGLLGDRFSRALGAVLAEEKDDRSDAAIHS